MTAPRWILVNLTSVILLAMLSIAAMIDTDFTGVFRDPRGRSLPIFYTYRSSKALLNERYVPANYNALLLGPSSSSNWSPALITSGTDLRMYNESLEGGNATEEKWLAEQALQRGHFRVALIVIFPTMVASHDYKEAMDKTRWTQALGSIDSFLDGIFSEMKLHGVPFKLSDADPDGSHGLHYPGGMNEGAIARYTIDPTGFNNLRQLVIELKQRGTKVIYVVPPLYEVVRVRSNPGLANIDEDIRQQLPTGPWINLNDPQYIAFRLDRTNYHDAFHLSAKGAEEVGRILHAGLCALPQAQYPPCNC